MTAPVHQQIAAPVDRGSARALEDAVGLRRPYAGPMHPQQPRQRWTARHPVLLDAVLAVVALLVDVFVTPRLGGHPWPSSLETVLTALALGLVPLRHRWPVPALAVTVAVASVVVGLRGHENAAMLAPLACLYLVALRRDRRTTALAWATTVVALAGANVLGHPGSSLVDRTLPLLPWPTVAAVLGDGVRNRRAYLTAVEERAERAERTREEVAGRRVAEERVRIARELHDVVAHHTAVVTVQAGVAQHLLLTRPEAASAALGHVREAAGAVLDELGDILSVLREPGAAPGADGADSPGGVGGDRAPVPGLDRLDALVRSFTAAGLEVRWSVDGRPRSLPPAVDLAAYRLVEESLTNALKHGSGAARLRVEHTASSLRLRVDNAVRPLVPSGAGTAGPGRAPEGTGHGMTGMRERAAAVGGTLAAGPREGRFAVEAVLPLRESVPS